MMRVNDCHDMVMVNDCRDIGATQFLHLQYFSSLQMSVT